MSLICLVTRAQPSVNPRIVKEADVLAEAGHSVRVVCAHYVPWADDKDRELLRDRQWKCEYVGGEFGAFAHNVTRVRHHAAKEARFAWAISSRVRNWALERTTPELIAAACRERADLFIGHYPAALVAAAEAARRFNARLGFDCEDFETGQGPLNEAPSAMDRLVERVERQYLPACDFVVASSDGIGAAYREKYGIPTPVTILNTFPLADRPGAFRPTAKSGPLTLFWFSQTIGPDRGLDDVVRALGKLQELPYELHLLGRWLDGYREQFMSLARGSGVDEGSIVTHEPVGPRELIALAAKFDVGLALEMRVSVNRDICVTNKLFTYFLAGNAVAATRTSGQQAILARALQAGLTYESGDVASLAMALERWATDRSSLDACRRASWDAATAQFNWEREKRSLVSLVERTLRRD